MRHLVILLATFATIGAASARPAPEQRCIAVGSPYQRVAAIVASPADCCSGRMQCSQMLSTTTVVRPQHDQRT